MPLTPARYSPWFFRVFAGYTRRLFARRFHAVRLARGTAAFLSDLAPSPRPLIVVLNHASWWDPLTSLLLAHALAPGRALAAPMDDAMLRKFGFFRRVGVFGIDPDDPHAGPEIIAYLRSQFAQHPHPSLWITPQGQFTDARDPIRIRPGAAAIAAAFPDAHVVSLAIEYAFWIDQKPEVLMRLMPVAPESAAPRRTNSTDMPAPTTLGLPAGSATPSTTMWYRALTRTMQDNADALAALVRARDPEGFDTLLGTPAKVHPLYDLFLRATGRGGGAGGAAGLVDRRRDRAATGRGRGGRNGA